MCNEFNVRWYNLVLSCKKQKNDVIERWGMGMLEEAFF